MSDPEIPDRESDLRTLRVILAGAPEDGFSIAEIAVEITKRNDSWTYRTINALLCELGHAIRHEKIKSNRGKVTTYRLRNRT